MKIVLIIGIILLVIFFFAFIFLWAFIKGSNYRTADGYGRGSSNAYIADMKCADAGADIFRRGLCLPTDIGMTEDEQEHVIEVIRRCFL